MLKATLISVLLASSLVSADAQTRPVSSDHAVIEGSVINVQNGRLVPRATVILRNVSRRAEAKSVRADGAGHFLFKDLQPGAYRLSAERQGFFPDRRQQTFQVRVEVAAGEDRRDVLLRLVPTAVIVGRVVDENSDPMQHVQIQLLSRAYRNGRLALDIGGIGLTDDRGEYRIYDVRPGRYYVLAQATSGLRAKGLQVVATTKIVGVIQVAGSNEPEPEPDVAYAPLFFPDTSDFQQAQVLSISPGDELRANFIMMAKPSVSVQGRVVNGVTNSPATRADVTIAWNEHLDIEASVAVSPDDGTFEIRDLAPGFYVLRTSFTEDKLTYTGRQTIEVGPLGMKNALLVGMPDSEVSGTVRVEGSEAERNALKRMAFDFRRSDAPGNSMAAAKFPDLQFQVALHPGDRYAVAALNLPSDYYLKGVTVSGQAVATNDIIVANRRGAIELTLSPAGGHLEGLVLNEKGAPVSGSVVLIPEEAKRDDRSLFRRAAAGSKGQFVFRGIVPGTYKLLAFDDIDLEELIDDPALLKRYQDRSQTLIVGERGNYSVPLEIIRISGEP